MSVERIADPGFEVPILGSDLGEWELSSSGAAVTSPGDAHGGSNVLEWRGRRGFSDITGKFGQRIPIPTPNVWLEHRLRFWIRRTSAGSVQANVRLRLWKGFSSPLAGPGVAEVLAERSFQSLELAEEWTQYELTLTPGVPDVTIGIDLEIPTGGAPFFNVTAELDDFSLLIPEVDMARTADISNELERVLAFLSLAVYSSPQNVAKLTGDLPALTINGFGGLESDPSALSNRKGAARQRVRMTLYVEGEEGSRALENELDSVRNVLENPSVASSGSLARYPSWIDHVTVVSADPNDRTPAKGNELHSAELEVEVSYLYDRGAL